jgi:octaprenyl-diphosphate synthase
MMNVQEIQSPIIEELSVFEEKFKASMESRIPILNRVTHYMIKRKGKQVRPMFLFLVAKMLGDTKERTFIAAILMELLHNATLVHDDVVDDAHERRGFFSVNALWKNKVAVLLGDFLLSRSLLLSIDNKDFRSLEIVSKAVKAMSEGELLQIEKARRLDITEEVYMEVIRQKTASLIAACCEAAAVSVDREDMAERMFQFGELIGLAFQIKDDIFDYGNGEKIGKPTGNDIREQKMTLPIIYAINKGDAVLRKKLINIVKRHNENPQKVNEAIQLVIQSGGIKYAHQKMMELKDKALLLLSDIPESSAKKSLVGLVEYTVYREK